MEKDENFAVYAGEQKALIEALEIINEAEAKWEADYCEWIHEKHYANCLCRCNGIFIEYDFAISLKVCPYCGKPIKIVEAE